MLIIFVKYCVSYPVCMKGQKALNQICIFHKQSEMWNDITPNRVSCDSR